MPVKFTPRAEHHINDLHDYIKRSSGKDRADRYTRRIVAFCGSLATFPERGRSYDDLLPGLRLIGFERRILVAFVASEHTVLIEGVLYAGRDVAAALRTPD